MRKIISLLLILISVSAFSQVDSTYYERSVKVLEKFPKSRVTAEDLYTSAKIVYEEQGIVVPLELAIAQAIIETSLGGAGVGKTRNNPYCINSKKGYVKYNNVVDGVLAYYRLIASRYLKCNSVDSLLKNFKHCQGYRYASSKVYETTLKKQYYKIKKIING